MYIHRHTYIFMYFTYFYCTVGVCVNAHQEFERMYGHGEQKHQKVLNPLVGQFCYICSVGVIDLKKKGFST